MKTLLASVLLLTVTASLLAQSADEKAIQEVLAAETQSWIDRDYNAWAATWRQDGDILWTAPGLKYESWDSLSAMMKTDMTQNPKKLNQTCTNDDFHISIHGNIAVAHYRQTCKSGKESYRTNETRNLVKDDDGKWKISWMVNSPDITEQNQQNVLTHLAYASQMLVGMNRPDDGLKIAEAAMGIYPDVVDGYWGAGWIYFTKGDKANALKHLEKALAIAPDNENLKSFYEQVKNMEGK